MWLLGVALLLTAVTGQERRTYTVNRFTLHMQCPPRAVCAEMYEFDRERNGILFPERRIIYNCQCPGSYRCPTRDDLMLHDTWKHKMYFCEDDFRAFNDCPEREIAAEEIVEGYVEDDFMRYVRINCVCPRHRVPVTPERGQLEKATYWYRNERDWGNQMRYQRYSCKRS